jgi:uncharacterized protein YecE (DUF72 family)
MSAREFDPAGHAGSTASGARRLLIGTAGWGIPRPSAHRFATEGTHLERYARMFACAEINSSFHRPHAFATYARWAAVTPADFRFAVKLPRTITHDLKLRRPDVALAQFLEESSGLGAKRGPILVQLPPSLAFDARVVGRFFERMRASYVRSIVCEPRHESWFSSKVDRLFTEYDVARVAADPPRSPGADVPIAWHGLVYVRLHGSPRTYWSAYSEPYIYALGQTLRAMSQTAEAWCIFEQHRGRRRRRRRRGECVGAPASHQDRRDCCLTAHAPFVRSLRGVFVCDQYVGLSPIVGREHMLDGGIEPRTVLMSRIRNPAIAADQQMERRGFHLQPGAEASIVDRDRRAHPGPGDERAHLGGIVADTGIDGDHLDPIAKPLVELLEPRHLRQARKAVGRPELEIDRRFAVAVRQVDRAAVDRLQRDRRPRRADEARELEVFGDVSGVVGLLPASAGREEEKDGDVSTVHGASVS